jgi:hypothetical protein
MELRYRTGVSVGDLALGECTIRSTVAKSGKRWWSLWFYVARETDGVPEMFIVPVNPNGPFTESGPGGRTWGLTRTWAGVWQVAPSIDVLDDVGSRAVLAGQPRPPESRSLWHQTPALVGVPEDEAWISGDA